MGLQDRPEFLLLELDHEMGLQGRPELLLLELDH